MSRMDTADVTAAAFERLAFERLAFTTSECDLGIASQVNTAAAGLAFTTSEYFVGHIRNPCCHFEVGGWFGCNVIVCCNITLRKIFTQFQIITIAKHFQIKDTLVINDVHENKKTPILLVVFFYTIVF